MHWNTYLPEVMSTCPATEIGGKNSDFHRGENFGGVVLAGQHVGIGHPRQSGRGHSPGAGRCRSGLMFISRAFWRSCM